MDGALPGLPPPTHNPLKMKRRSALKILGKSSFVPLLGGFPAIRIGAKKVDLTEVRERVNDHFRSLLIEGAPYGAYATGTADPTDVYAPTDIAIARHIMGEVLTDTLSDTQRRQWIDYINSYQNPEDGSYRERYRHSKLHANGMVIGALGVLGGRQQYPVKLYDAFDTIPEVGPWLEQIDWAKQWGASHLFWGGIHCYSLSSRCDPEWLAYVFRWLDDNLDEQTGWWRKGTVYTDRHQPLGGSVHIIPIYQHHGRRFPEPERVIDSVLALQLPSGRWLDREKDRKQIMHYLELDALYALSYAGSLAPGYREDDIMKSVNRYADLVHGYWNGPASEWQQLHPHRTLSMVGTFGLLQKMLPERFVDAVEWTDIFSDIRLYDTAAVEAV